MAQITAQAPSETGAALTYTAAGVSGDSFTNTGKEVIHVKNGGGSSITVTVKSRDTAPDVSGYGPVSKPDRQVTISAGGDRMIGPFPQKAFNEASTGRVSLTYSSTTSVSAAVIAVRPVS